MAFLVLAVGACSGDAVEVDAESAMDDARPVVEGALEPGRYELPFLGISQPTAILDVPVGFAGAEPGGWYLVSLDNSAFLGLWTINAVHNHPCRGDGSDYTFPGPAVDDLADAFVDQPFTRATEPKPVTVDGQEGLYLELKIPADVGRCKKDELDLWSSPGGRGYESGQIDRLWILDVEGQRVIIDASFLPETSQDDITALEGLVTSIHLATSRADG